MPCKEKVCFFKLDTWAERRRLLKLTIHLPKEVTEHLYCRLLSSASKVEADQKDDFWLTKTFFGGEENKQPPTRPNPHILNNLCIVVKGKQASAWFGVFFSALSSKATPNPAESTQTQGCCCLPSYKAQERIFILANSEQFSLKASTQHALLTPWQP